VTRNWPLWCVGELANGWPRVTADARWRQQLAPHDVSSRHGTCFRQGRMGYGASMADASMGSPEKDPEDWVTGDEPMTGPQRSYLETLAREAGEDIPADLTKAQASELIDRLQEKTGRGR
jgi:hypothetical protein